VPKATQYGATLAAAALGIKSTRKSISHLSSDKRQISDIEILLNDIRKDLVRKLRVSGYAWYVQRRELVGSIRSGALGLAFV